MQLLTAGNSSHPDAGAVLSFVRAVCHLGYHGETGRLVFFLPLNEDNPKAFNMAFNVEKTGRMKVSFGSAYLVILRRQGMKCKRDSGHLRELADALKHAMFAGT